MERAEEVAKLSNSLHGFRENPVSVEGFADEPGNGSDASLEAALNRWRIEHHEPDALPVRIRAGLVAGERGGNPAERSRPSVEFAVEGDASGQASHEPSRGVEPLPVSADQLRARPEAA